jgi:hypothetical protein
VIPPAKAENPLQLAELVGHYQTGHELVVVQLLGNGGHTQETRGDRIELKNLAKQAVHQLHVAGEDKQVPGVVRK